MIDKRFLKMYCKKFNEDKINPLADKLIIELFNEENPYDISPRDHFLRVALIDYLWGTQLTKKKDSIYDLSEKIRNSLSKIKQKISYLPSQNLLNLELSPENCEIIQDCIKIIRGCCNIKTGISFSCKYLHFLKPSLFIPWDSSVPESIKKLLDKEIDTEHPLEEGYFELIRVYKEIASNFQPDEIKEIINFDYETQSPYQASRKNTFIRIIDKALWEYKQ